MVKLRLQELAAAKFSDNKLTTDKPEKHQPLVLLSQAAGISETDIQKYATDDVNISAAIDDLKKIARVLEVESVDLVAPQKERKAIKLKIAKLAESKGVNLSELSQKSQVDINIICFYCTQPIEIQKLDEPKFHANLTAISKVLECSIDDLRDTTEVALPATRLLIQEFSNERNLSLEELSLLTEMNSDLIDLLINNPVDMKTVDSWLLGDAGILCKLICNLFGCKCRQR